MHVHIAMWCTFDFYICINAVGFCPDVLLLIPFYILCWIDLCIWVQHYLVDLNVTIQKQFTFNGGQASCAPPSLWAPAAIWHTSVSLAPAPYMLGLQELPLIYAALHSLCKGPLCKRDSSDEPVPVSCISDMSALD